jgi:hypothetical protein
MSLSDNDKINNDNFSISIRLTIAKKCSNVIINEVEDELNPEKTEILDFACGTGTYYYYYYYYYFF